MATSRCVQLMLVTMANDLKEVWIADHPFLLMFYLWQYMPTLAWWLTNKAAKRRIENFKSGVVSPIIHFWIHISLVGKHEIFQCLKTFLTVCQSHNILINTKDIKSFPSPYPFVCWWASRLLPCPGYDKQCCDERWTLGCTWLFRIWFPWCVCPEVGLLCHMDVIFPVF